MVYISKQKTPLHYFFECCHRRFAVVSSYVYGSILIYGHVLQICSSILDLAPLIHHESSSIRLLLTIP